MSTTTTINLPFAEEVTQQYLSRKEAARYLHDNYGAAAAVAASTLAKLATIGGGPEFRRFGRRVGYSRQALDAFVKSRASSTLTSTTTPDYLSEASSTLAITMTYSGGGDGQQA